MLQSARPGLTRVVVSALRDNGCSWTRKPSAAPAVIAASTPAESLPRSNAITANAARFMIM